MNYLPEGRNGENVNENRNSVREVAVTYCDTEPKNGNKATVFQEMKDTSLSDELKMVASRKIDSLDGNDREFYMSLRNKKRQLMNEIKGKVPLKPKLVSRKVVKPEQEQAEQTEHNTQADKKQTSMDVNEFRPAKRRGTACSSQPVKKTIVSIKNKYAPLASVSTEKHEDDENETDIEKEETEDDKEKEKKKSPPPPSIILDKDYLGKEQIQYIKELTKNNYYLRYRNNIVEVCCRETTHQRKLYEMYQLADTPCFTRTNKADKKHAFVLKGVDIQIGNEEEIINDIMEELRSNNINVIKVSKMKGTQRPLYLVLTKPVHTDKDLNNKIKTILSCRCRWERHVNKKILTQCHRCQRWQHGQSTCNMPFRCVKCGQDHPSYECKKDRNEPATCANCAGPHPASSVECPRYLNILEARERTRLQQQKPAPKYTSAPQPRINPWQQRTQARTTQQIQTPTFNNEHFPALPTQRVTATADNDDETWTRKVPKTRASPAISSLGDTTVTGGLFGAFERVGNVINIGEMIQALNDYATLLEGCNTPTEKFTRTLAFIQGLDKYNF